MKRPSTIRLILLLFALQTFVVSDLLAQSAQIGMNVHDHLLIRESRRAGTELVSDYEGTPYYDEDFKSASVSTENMNFIPVPMRYKISEGIMEFTVGSMYYILDPDPRIKRIEIGNDVFVVSKGSKSEFLLLHTEGPLSVVSRMVVNLRPANDLTGIPAKYSRQADVLFVMLEDRSIVKPSSLKSFIELLPDHKEEVASFAKAKKLSVKSKNELVELVNHYNSLAGGTGN
jgi:hypothetical protein